MKLKKFLECYYLEKIKKNLFSFIIQKKILESMMHFSQERKAVL